MAELLEEFSARLQALRGRGVAVVALARCEALLRRLRGQDARLQQQLLPVLAARLAALEAAPGRAAVKPAAPVATGFPALLAVLERRQALATDREPPLEAVLDAARAQWRTLRAQSQLRQMLVQPREDVGPLNSARLVARAMQQLQAISPGYVDCLLTYLDTLAGLVPLAGVPDEAGAGVLPGRKPARPRVRKRKDAGGG